MKNILTHCGHALLEQKSTWAQIKEVCDDGLKYNYASVCIPTSFVEQAADYMGNELEIYIIIGFLSGYPTTTVKVSETEDTIHNDAGEIDMVINIGWVRDQRQGEMLVEIKAIRTSCQGRILEMIVETYLLTKVEKIKLCELVTEPGADYIRASTDFPTGSATQEGVALFRAHTGSDMKIKAVGSISSFQDAEDFMALGADHLSTSWIIKLMRDKHAGGC